MASITRCTVMVTIDLMAQEDPDFMAHVRLKGETLLSDARKMQESELIERLLALGFDIRREMLEPMVASMKSAADLEDELIRRFKVTLSDMDDDFVYVALTALWERWFPDVPNGEMLEESLQRGYRLVDPFDNPAEIIEEWDKAWETVRALASKFRALSVEDFDRMFPTDPSILEWGRDFAMELEDAEMFGIPAMDIKDFMDEFNRTFPLSAGRLTLIGDAKPPKRVKVGRNDPCPCGSGKKFKKCCGRQKRRLQP